MRSVQQCVAEYYDAPESADLSRSSRKREKIVIRRLTAQIGSTQPISRLERRHVDQALKTWRGKITDASMNAYKTDLRRFGKWLLLCGYVRLDPAAHLENVKTKTVASKRKPIQSAQAQWMIKLAEDRHPRDGMTVKILLNTGLRGSEVKMLQWRDIDLNRNEARVYRMKTKDWHFVYFHPQTTEDLINWKEYYEAKHGSIRLDWYVVPALAHKGENPGFLRMDPDWPMVPGNPQSDMAKRIKIWLAEVGETDLWGRATHTLRRTAANLLIDEGGADIREVQTFLGHASVAMTEIYLDKSAARDKLRDRLQNFHVGSPYEHQQNEETSL